MGIANLLEFAKMFCNADLDHADFVRGAKHYMFSSGFTPMLEILSQYTLSGNTIIYTFDDSELEIIEDDDGTLGRDL